jgi:hypothetical protein
MLFKCYSIRLRMKKRVLSANHLWSNDIIWNEYCPNTAMTYTKNRSAAFTPADLLYYIGLQKQSWLLLTHKHCTRNH